MTPPEEGTPNGEPKTPETCELVLKSFRFPRELSNSKANFRFVVDLRFIDDKENFDSEHAVMPSLDTFWECDTNRQDKPNFVRDVSRAASSTPFASFDMSRIDSWDALILGVKAKGLHSVQFKVIDVNRADAWDWVKGVLGGIIETLKYQAKKTIEATQKGDGEDETEQVVDKTLVSGSIGGAAADLRSFTLKRLARGGDVLYRGSTRFENGVWNGGDFIPEGYQGDAALGPWIVTGSGTEGPYAIRLAVRDAMPPGVLW